MSNIKVSVMFTLSGKTLDVPKRKAGRDSELDDEDYYEQYLPTPKWNNEDTLDLVKQKVHKHFGVARSVFVANEDMLSEDRLIYPAYFSAGWFVSSDGKTELVVVDHGATMELANKSMLSSVTKIDWEQISKATGL